MGFNHVLQEVTRWGKNRHPISGTRFPPSSAGSYIAVQPDFPDEAAALIGKNCAQWREVVLWAVGVMARLKKMTQVAVDVAAALCPREVPDRTVPEADWRAAHLAGEALLLIGLAEVKARERHEQVLARVRRWLVPAAERGALSPVDRSLAADTLARLGDPRPGVSVDSESGLPDLQWCLVPPGAFRMGSRKDDDDAYDDEKPQHEQNVPHPYWIARYPVTNAQFQAFVDDPAGYPGAEWWTRAGLSWRKDRTGPERRGGVYDLPNHPAVMITWYETAAWCRWLTREMRDAGFLPNDWEIRLPSEAEWEKAARGGLHVPARPVISDDLRSPIPDTPSLIANPHPARRLPWGGEADPNRANYVGTGIGSTSAVGCFPDGASPYGCLDLSGNVWEWCATKWVGDYQGYATKEDTGLEGESRRVVRGGAFSYDSWIVRCAFRGRYNPDFLYGTQGFRAAAAPVRL